MYNMHKKCIVEDTTVTLCEIDTSKMYNMHKKCIVRILLLYILDVSISQ